MKQTSMSILLIEDHEDSREAIRRWLEWKGYKVSTAADQQSGLALAFEKDFDLMICDLQLPDGNGWELMEKLSAVKPVRALITSGHCSGADIARSKALGFLEHLVKPYPVEELEALLARIRDQGTKAEIPIPAQPLAKPPINPGRGKRQSI